MQLIADEVDGNIYVDVVVSPAEIRHLKENEIVSGKLVLRHRNYYIGIRLQGIWDYDEEEDKEDSEKECQD